MKSAGVKIGSSSSASLPEALSILIFSSSVVVPEFFVGAGVPLGSENQAGRAGRRYQRH